MGTKEVWFRPLWNFRKEIREIKPSQSDARVTSKQIDYSRNKKASSFPF
jgi:hypothetical protein